MYQARANKTAYLKSDKAVSCGDLIQVVDSGFGFAQPAVNALEGLHTVPAEGNGQPVAVRFRYPIRFTLK